MHLNHLKYCTSKERIQKNKILILNFIIMKTRILNLLIVAALFISTAGLAQPAKQGNQGNQFQKREARMMKCSAQQRNMHEKLFTDEQQESIKALRLETAKKVKPFKNELRELMAHQQTLTTADNADLKAINKNIDKMSETKTEIAKIMAAQHQKIRSLLTEEQLLKFDMMKNNHGKKAGRDSMGPHGRMGV